MNSGPFQNSVDTIVRSLRAGKGRAAAEAFQEVSALSENPGQVGRELGSHLAALWDDFFIEAVHGFASWLGQQSENPAAAATLESIAPFLDMCREWERMLHDIVSEREARTLREQVRSDALGDALKLSRSILSRSRSPEALRTQAVRLGVILGSLDHDRPAADRVMKRLASDLGAKGDAGREAVQGLAEGCDQSRKNLTLTETGSRELQWNRMHTDAVVTLIQRLPDTTSAGQPTPEQEERAWRAFHSLLAAWFRLASRDGVEFGDIVRILREFCPTDPRAAGPVEGVEDVAFLRMNSLAKLTSVRTLRRIGEKKRVVDATLGAFHETERGSRASELLIRLMGGLSNSAFTEDLLDALGDRQCRHMIDEIVDALGRVGDARCHVTLEKRLEDTARARTLDPPKRRHMENVIAALGRIARHPKTSRDDRNAIARRVFEVLPDERDLARAALSHFCSFDPAGLAPDVQRLAVRFVVDSLWSQDTASRLAPGDPAQRSELGFREELVAILTGMGSAALPAVLEEAQRRVMQYSGAYWAIADALAEIGDASAMPLLRMMTVNTVRTNEDAIPEHLRESYFDAAANKRVPLSKDKIAYALVFAINKIGGADGQDFLTQVADRIRAGEWDAPGAQTMELLAEILVPGRLSEAAPSPESVAAPEEPGGGLDGVPEEWLEEAGETRAAPPEADAADVRPRPRRDDSDKALLKDILGKGLFKTKIEARVSAIQEAARRADTQFVEPLCSLLDAKEIVLRGAAETALLEIVRPSGDSSTFRIGLADMLDSLRDSSEAQAKAISRLVMQMRPDRNPTRQLIEGFAASESDARMKRILGDILDPPAHKLGVRPSAVAAEPEATDEGEDQPAPDNRDAMQRKMEYMAARRQWIANGKQGDPPEPPEGYGINL